MLVIVSLSTLSFPSVIWDCCENRKDVPYKVSVLQQASIREKRNVSEDQDTRDLLFTQSIQLLATPWTASRQASLSFTTSQSLLKLISIKSVMPSNHLALCCPLLLLSSIFPSIRVFSNELFFASGGQSIGASASASVLPMNIQDSSPLGLTGFIPLQSKGLSRVFSNTTVRKCQFFGTHPGCLPLVQTPGPGAKDLTGPYI